MGENVDVPPIVAPVVHAGEDLTDPVIQHTERITRIEEQQAQQQERMIRELGDLESRLRNATQEEAQSLYRRIDALEEKITALATKPVEEVEEAPGEAVEFVEPAVEPSPAPPEKERRGLRYRRKARKSKK